MLLLTLSSHLIACDKCMCKYWLDIIIANTTTSDCILTGQSLNSGSVYSKNLPLRIAPGEQSLPYTIESDLSSIYTNISMNIQCGADKFITLQTQRDYKSGYWNPSETVTGIITAAANLDASYVAKISNCNIPKAASIYWTVR